MKDYGRDLRIADFIRDELAEIIRRDMRDPRIGMVSVNEVTVSKDLSYADVYVSSWQTPDPAQRDEFISVLTKAAGFFRSELARRHRMRTTPKLRFHYDEIIERGPELEALIESAVQADAAQHGQDKGGDDRG
jgi:ribosome-binding factor A